MTPEDLQQIRTLIEEVIEEKQLVTRGDLERVIQEKQLVTRGDLDRAMESVADEFTELRKDMKTRLETLDRRTERIEVNVNSIQMQTAGMSKSLTDGERLDSSFAAQLGAQQRAIDDLYRQIAELKRQQPPH